MKKQPEAQIISVMKAMSAYDCKLCFLLLLCL